MADRAGRGRNWPGRNHQEVRRPVTRVRVRVGWCAEPLHLLQLAGRVILRVLAGQTDAAKSAGEEARPLLEATLREQPDDTVFMTALSWVYLALGHRLRHLLSINAGLVTLARLKIDPVRDPIRNRPDFQQLLSGPEQIGPGK